MRLSYSLINLPAHTQPPTDPRPPTHLHPLITEKMAGHGRMWQRAYGFFGSTFFCTAMQRNIYIFLYFITHVHTQYHVLRQHAA